MGGRTPQGGQGYGGGPGAQAVADPAEEIKRAIRDDDPELLVKLAELNGRRLAEARLTTSQIRGIFGAARSMESLWSTRGTEDDLRSGRRALLFLKPKLAYQEARHRTAGPGVSLLRTLLEPAIDSVGSDREKFRRFLDYFEALLAYHKASGGRD